jgi:hypothetical protein
MAPGQVIDDNVEAPVFRTEELLNPLDVVGAQRDLQVAKDLRIRVSIFVGRSSTIECTCHPHPKFGNKCKDLIAHTCI